MKKIGTILIMTFAMLLVSGVLPFPDKAIANDDDQDDFAVEISNPIDGASVEVGESITFTALVPIETPGDAPYAFTWDFGNGSGAFGQSFNKTYSTAGTYTVVLIATDFSGQTTTDSITITVTDPIVALATSITASATTIVEGDSVDFTAVASGGTTPIAHSWTIDDTDASFGETFTNIFATVGTYVITLTSTDFNGLTATDSVTITVTEDGNGVTFEVSIDASATTVVEGDSINFTAIISPTAPGTDPYAHVWSIDGVEVSFSDIFTNTFAADGIFVVTLTSTDFDGLTATDSVTITVTEDGGGGDDFTTSITTSATTVVEGGSIDFTAVVSGGTASFAHSWSVDSNDAAIGETFTNTFANAGDYVVTLTSTDFNGLTATDSVTITVTEGGNGGGDDLAISNVQVINVGQNSATITWTTNLASDSRVVYDSVSHGDISGASAPNFDYQFSTATSDEAGVTSHSVELTGLSTNTQYFFRVLSREI